MNQTSARRRYQVLMKQWRRLRRLSREEQTNTQRQRRRVLEELRALDLEDPAEEWRGRK